MARGSTARVFRPTHGRGHVRTRRPLRCLTEADATSIARIYGSAEHNRVLRAQVRCKGTWEGPGAETKPISLSVEDRDYMGRIKQLQEYLDKVKRSL
ncbi:unnamed protein product [Urochloa humidicola]